PGLRGPHGADGGDGARGDARTVLLHGAPRRPHDPRGGLPRAEEGGAPADRGGGGEGRTRVDRAARARGRRWGHRARPPGPGAALARVIERATVALCAEMCGGAQKVLDLTSEYAKIRVAFGKPIGTYQGVKHKAADMLVGVENAKSLTYYAAWAVDENVPEAPLAVSMAKAYTSDAYREVSGTGIQLHGGIGFTWE